MNPSETPAEFYRRMLVEAKARSKAAAEAKDWQARNSADLDVENYLTMLKQAENRAA